MADILIRKLEEDVVEKLRVRAKSAGRSLEAEARKVLTESVNFDWDRVWELRDSLGEGWSDSAESIREDRER